MKPLSATIRIAAIAAIASAAIGSANANSLSTFPDGQSFFGQAASMSNSARSVDVSGRRYVNVDFGETISFRSNGKVFTWTFNGFDRRAVRLNQIAPDGFATSDMMIYIGPNPYLGG